MWGFHGVCEVGTEGLWVCGMIVNGSRGYIGSKGYSVKGLWGSR